MKHLKRLLCRLGLHKNIETPLNIAIDCSIYERKCTRCKVVRFVVYLGEEHARRLSA